MSTRNGMDGLESPRSAFDVVWRGYDPRQVERYLDRVEADIRLLATDRDAAVACSEDLLRDLETLRSENRTLRERIKRITRTPISADSLTERLGCMLELAQQEAAEVIAQAQAAADLSDRHRRNADEQSDRLQQQAGVKLERDMATRRAQSMAALAEQVDAAKANAERLIREASEYARRLVADAHQQVDSLDRHRERIIGRLRSARELLHDVDPMLRPDTAEPEPGSPSHPAHAQPVSDSQSTRQPPDSAY